MNTVARGVRNAFRNAVRTFSIVAILGLSIGLSLAMLVARQAVTQKIASVKSSVGNTVSVSPAGVRGFEGGGSPLTSAQVDGLKSLAHVTSVDESLNDRLTSSNTSLQSAVDAGALGRRFAGNSGQTFTPNGDSGFGGGMSDMSGAGSSAGSGDTPSFRTSFTPPVTVIGTTAPTSLSNTTGGGTFKLTSGAVFAGTSTDNVALIGASLASKNNLSVGSTFTAYGTTITVSGIFDAGNAFSNNQLIMPLATVQKLSSQTGDITSATLHVDSVSNVNGVTSAAEKSLGSAADVTNASQEAQTAIAPLQNIQTISLYSLIGAVAAGTAIILLTMIMIVRERRREIGVLKAIGASSATVMFQFMAEAVTLTLLGAVIGIAFGVVAGNPITKTLVNNSVSSSATTSSGGMAVMGRGSFGGGSGAGFGGTHFRAGRGTLTGLHNSVTNITANIGWSIILYGLGVAILIAIIGSAIASYFISKVRPAEVMRTE